MMEEKTRRDYLKAVAALSSASLAGCAAEGSEMSKKEAEDVLDDVTEVGSIGGWDIHRAIDREAGLVLYIPSSMAEGTGITAVPIEQTKFASE